jgi:hypothetical protein
VAGNGGPGDPPPLTRVDLTPFRVAMTEQWESATCSVVFRVLQQFSAGWPREGEVDRSPQPVPVLLSRLHLRGGHVAEWSAQDMLGTGGTRASSVR